MFCYSEEEATKPSYLLRHLPIAFRFLLSLSLFISFARMADPLLLLHSFWLM